MPTLNWIGKERVANHHLDVPYRVLNHKYGFKDGKQGKAETESGNMIIQGDNLEALKALLPKYEGKVKCIYIDPPYNTGNEGWIYNDKVNDPKIIKWLGKVVGQEGEDLSRHDKWLCMMYPRLRLLHKLLRDDGVIFVSIDDNELKNLWFIMDEVFGESNIIDSLIWKKRYQGAKEKFHAAIHEYILVYAKQKSALNGFNISTTEEFTSKYFTNRDDKYSIRGGYRTQPLEAGNSMDSRPNLIFPILAPDGSELMPRRQWVWGKERVENALANGDLDFTKDKRGKWSVRFKQYLKDEHGTTRRTKPFSIIDDVFTQDGTKEIYTIFNNNIFPFPKPSKLIKRLLDTATGENCKDALILDSFAGSGTTAHAVLNLNKEDDGNRKFILVEFGDYADSITAERNKRVIQGFGETGGTGGAFDFYELGVPLFKDPENLNEEVGEEKIREYVWYTETQEPIPTTKNKNKYFLGVHNATDYYFYYERDQVTTLDYKFLATMKHKAESSIIYADTCALPEKYLLKHGITFKKIPRDISKF